MTLQLGVTAPDFEAETTQGRISFHDWVGDDWAVLFSHPKDFTPVCTTEPGYMAKIIAGSVSDEEARHTYPQGWKAPQPYIRIVPQPS